MVNVRSAVERRFVFCLSLATTNQITIRVTSLSIRISEISFDREIFSELMQPDILHLRSLAHVTEAGARREGNRPGSCQDFRRVVEKNFVDRIRRERGPVDGRAALNHQAGNFQLCQAPQDCREIGSSIRFEGCSFLDPDPTSLELCLFPFIRDGAEDEYIKFALGCRILYEP